MKTHELHQSLTFFSLSSACADKPHQLHQLNNVSHPQSTLNPLKQLNSLSTEAPKTHTKFRPLHPHRSFLSRKAKTKAKPQPRLIPRHR